MKTVREGVSQLRYAMPAAVSSALAEQAYCNADSDQHITFVHPILLTNARLLVLRPDAELEDVLRCNDVGEVLETEATLVVESSPGPALESYADGVMNAVFKNYPRIAYFVDQLSTLQHKSPLDTAIAHDELRYLARMATERVQVVNLDCFENVVRDLLGILRTCGYSLHRVARISFDPNDRVAKVEAPKASKKSGNTGEE